MSLDDPQTEDERALAECFVVAVREPVGMWRPHGVTLGRVARDAMLVLLADREPALDRRAISLQTAREVVPA